MRKRDAFVGIIENILPACALAAKLAPVPYLDAAFCLLIEIFNATQEASHSKSALNELNKSIGEFVVRANERASATPQVPKDQDIEKLTALLREIKLFVDGEKQLSTLKFLITRNDRLQKIEGFHWRLEHLGTALMCNAVLDGKIWLARFQKAAAKDHDIVLIELQGIQKNQVAMTAFIERQNTTIEAIQVCIAKLLKTQGTGPPSQETAVLKTALVEFRRFSGSTEKIESWTISPFEIELGAKIGSGGFGSVHRGLWQQHTNVAVKLFNSNPTMAASSKVSIRHEIKVWSDLRHPNVIQFLGANTIDNSPFLVMPLLSSNVYEFLRDYPDCERSRIVVDIARGLNYLHNYVHAKGKGIVHGDLKAMNVLIDSAGNSVLCDFGLSKLKADVISQTKLIGTSSQVSGGSRCWMSPERLKGGLLKPPADVYAFGLVIYEIYSGEILFGEVDPEMFYDIVCKHEERPERPDNADLSDDMWSIATDCWKPLAKDRPEMSAVLGLLSSAAPPQSNDAPPTFLRSRSEPIPAMSDAAELPPYPVTTIHQAQERLASGTETSKAGPTSFALKPLFRTSSTAPSDSAEWDISAAEKSHADAYFSSLEISGCGYVGVEQASRFFQQQSLLSEGTIACVLCVPFSLINGAKSGRALSDFNGNGRLTKDLFAVAYRLTQDQCDGKPLPTSLPFSLVPPSLRRNYSSDALSSEVSAAWREVAELRLRKLHLQEEVHDLLSFAAQSRPSPPGSHSDATVSPLTQSLSDNQQAHSLPFSAGSHSHSTASTSRHRSHDSYRLRLSIRRAYDLPSKGLLKQGKPSAFVRILIKGRTFKMETQCVESDANPIWNEIFTIKVTTKDKITLEVRDAGSGLDRNKFIGEALFNVKVLASAEPDSEWTKVERTLYSDANKDVGCIVFRLQRAPDVEKPGVQHAQSMPAVPTARPSLPDHAQSEIIDQALPPDWEERFTNNGRAYYVDHSTQSTSWKRPVSLLSSPLSTRADTLSDPFSKTFRFRD